MKRRGWFLCNMLLLLFWQTPAYAQGVFGVDPTGRSGDTPPPLFEEQPSGPPPKPVLPSPPPPPARKPGQLPPVKVLVREIRIAGNTVFSAETLASVTAPYTNREVTSEDLEELRVALTRYYIDHGYVTSGAMIPDQTVKDGVITLRIIEGQLAQIEITGERRWFRDSYIQKRIAHGSGPPVNLNTLAEHLQLLQQDERILRLNAELRPGIKLGESTLRVQLEEDRPYKLWLGFNNHQSPTVGAERGFVTAVHQNLTGFGDILSFTYGRSDGLNPQIDTQYLLPLTARNTAIALQYRKNDFSVLEEPFEPLNARSESDIYGVSLRQPVYRTLNQEAAVVLTGEYLRNTTFLLGERFSFSPGARKGKSVVSALRFSLEWMNRTQTQVIATRSRFSVGLDVLGATNNRSGIADGQFFAWLGQFQWARRFGLWDVQTIFRLDLQVANDPLLAVEQIAIGGRYTVRGYRENQLVRDNGFVASLEARLPVIRDRSWADYLEFVPFVDMGHAWNVRTPTVGPDTIASIGIGVRWGLTFTRPWQWRPQFELYLGHQLRKVQTLGGDLQDEGIHLQLLVAAF